MGTKLEVRQGSGDFESWQTDYTISAPETLTFRWSTSEQGVTSAQWQVTDAANGFSQPSFSIIASGVLTHEGLFDIDFSPLLPVVRLMTPKPYYVRIVSFKKREELDPSPSAKVTYQSPGAPVVFGTGFDLDRFEQNLKSVLSQGTMGYSYAIFEHVNLVRAGAGGLAVSPNVPQSPDKRMTTMSMSKTITAAAVMKLMEEMRAQGKDISVDSLIASYLPYDFYTHGSHVNEMTFRHLLTHTSGLRRWPPADDPQDNTDPDIYENLCQTIARGAQADFGQPESEYANANFCLFRLLIPYMTGYVGHGLPFVEAINTGEAYVAYVRKHILEPIGLGDINVVPTGPKPYTRYYPDWSDPGESYGDPTDDTAMLRTGAGYWFMSAKEYARFIASLRNGLIVSAESFALMKPDSWRAVQDVYRGLGMYGRDSAHGRYWNHNGGMGKDFGRAYADWMIFPNGVTVVILVNSGLWGKPPQDVVEDAFNTAYV